jgi:hypothetical protein
VDLSSKANSIKWTNMGEYAVDTYADLDHLPNGTTCNIGFNSKTASPWNANRGLVIKAELTNWTVAEDKNITLATYISVPTIRYPLNTNVVSDEMPFE